MSAVSSTIKHVESSVDFNTKTGNGILSEEYLVNIFAGYLKRFTGCRVFSFNNTRSTLSAIKCSNGVIRFTLVCYGKVTRRVEKRYCLLHATITSSDSVLTVRLHNGTELSFIIL